MPYSLSTFTGEGVIAQGIEEGCVNIPSHKVNLFLDLATDSVMVSTRPSLNLKVYLCCLQDAGGKVVADPKATFKLITLVTTEKLVEGIPGISPPLLSFELWLKSQTITKDHYLLTIKCASTRFPKVVPLTNITAPKMSKTLINVFNLVGLIKEIQSDQD